MKTKLDLLREELAKMRAMRAKYQMEKGLAAEHNKDLRENADYDYWHEREQNMTIRILRLTKEISDLVESRR